MDSLDVIIPTCDKYMPIVEANLCGINHFWEKVGKVIVIGYNPPEFKLPEGVEFVSMGGDRTPSEWSNGLLSFFESYDKDKFILHMDDHCIVDYVDQDSIEKIKMIMDFDKKIDKIMLHPFKADIPLKTYNHKFEGLDLFICEKGYGSTTLMPAVWRNSYILSILAKGLTPHAFENQNNTTKIKNFTLSTYRRIMMISSLINKGKRNKNWQNCVHRSEFIFETPSEEYIQKINKIIDRTNFK